MKGGIVVIRQLTDVTEKRALIPYNLILSEKYKDAMNASTTRFEIMKMIKIHSDPKDEIVEPVVPVNDNYLAKIFTYVPKCERPKLALVCKQWKKTFDDSWFKVKKIEIIYWRYDEYPNCLDKYPTSDGGFCLIKSLLIKYGCYLTTLDLTAYGNCNIVPVINELCPNLVTLRLRFTNMDKLILANSFTRLSKLKSLTIIFQNIKTFLVLPTVALFNSLRNVANTLTNLNLLNWLDELVDIPNLTRAINDVIRDLKALKKLELAGIGISVDIFNYLTENGIVYSNHTIFLKKTLFVSDPFINIKVLNMMGCRITDDTLYTIANTFKHLTLLKIISHLVTDDGVVALSKMINLQYLIFGGNTNITDSSVKLLKNLIRLCLPTSDKVTDDSVLTVIENSPKIDVLSVYGTKVTAELVKKAAAISNKRERRLILCVASMPDIQQYESPYFELRMIRKIMEKKMVHVGTSAHGDNGLTTSARGQAQIS
ncbi:hypothetical protein HCN44_008153 [Aphidius gifuensis]|uniref:F-box domain-containing protein n=1 Tax=Aphidius gifuensis TaxID=684658 RepID=A0A835CNG1_APHGI|nr:uncharacterized protein LOC122857848 [Aphidius gifuensis]KAF7989479.1 hypothetical protein HCN44_008153 [Aphidius gifuensis]